MSRARDPYAAKSKAAPGGDRESMLTTFTRRLRRLGASEEMVADAVANWDNFDDDWTPESRRRFVHLNDTALAEHIAAVQQEWINDTTDEAEQRRAEREAAEVAAITEAEGRISGTIATLVEWVGDSPLRAWAVREVEPNYGNRSTLLAAVGPLAQEWDAAAT